MRNTASPLSAPGRGWGGVLLLLFAAPVLAADPPPAAKPPKALAGDVLDVVYLSSRGPLKLRFVLSNDGKPFALAWRAFADKVFDFHDRSGDGTLDAKEVANLAAFPLKGRGQNLLRFADAVTVPKPAARPEAALEKLDADKDGKVTRDEFAGWLKGQGLGPVSVSVRPPEDSARKLTDALFKYLDKDKDGELTPEECAAAPAALEQLDGDEDEIVTTAELLGQGPPNPYFVQGLALDTGVRKNAESDFIPLTGTADESAKAIIARRGGKEKAVTRQRLGCTEEAFKKLDDNGDGVWSADEVAGWLAGPADLEWAARQGDLSNTGLGWAFKGLGVSPPATMLAPVEALPSPLKGLVKPGENGGVRLDLSDAIVSLTAGAPQQTGYRVVANNSFVRQQFVTAAGEKKFLEKKDVQKDPNLNFVVTIFDAADRDADGKLTVNELDELLGLVGRGEQAQAVLTITDQGPDVFGLVDADRDRRLGVRELRSVWKRIEVCDRDGNGKVSKGELPRQYPSFVERGPLTEMTSFARTVAFTADMGNGLPGVTRGPLWFQKMDRNRDGDVSLKEFLGPPARFKELDADGDGLLSVGEATAVK